MTDQEFLNSKASPSKVDFRKILSIIWNMKYIVLISVILFIAGAYFYLRHTIPVYEKSITVVLKNQPNLYSDNYQLMSNTLGVDNKKGFENQIFILRSTRLMSRVVELGKFNIRYFKIGNFVETEQYTNSPVEYLFIPEANTTTGDINIEITFSGERVIVNSLLFNNEPIVLPTNTVEWGQPIQTPMGNIRLALKENVNASTLKGQMRIMHTTVDQMARTLVSAMDIATSVQQQDALRISLRGKHPRQLEDVLNLLIDEYNILTKENDSQGILSTISFLDERIEGLEEELKAIEGTFIKYRTNNELLDIESQSKIAMQSSQGYKERLSEVSLQLNLLTNVKEFTHRSTYELIPVNIGINDATLNTSISQYNQLILDRNRMLAGSSETNPKVQSINDVLITLKENIKQSINSLEEGYKLQLQSIASQQSQNQRELVAMPSKQLALTRMSRMQQVKEPLYTLLQQKREEALLMLSSLANQAYVVDKAFGSDLPVFPNKKNIFLLAVIIGVFIPTGIILLMNICREKVLFEKDVIDRTNIPLLGIIPSSLKNKKSPLKAELITHSGRDPLTESFRMMRSKLEYFAVNKKKPGAVVLQISSSGSWEGKSFISINMALSFAYMRKRVLLVGADLYKPTLSKYLGIDKNEKGLSTYLEGTEKDIHKVIKFHKETPNLDFIPPGPVPQDPGGLLALPLLSETLDSLRNEYDYIIVDSPPFMVVSGGFIISKYVDCTLYVLRSNYTRLSAIDTLNNIVEEGLLPSVMLMLNAVNFDKYSIYRTGEKYSYGYGYGYVYYDKIRGKK
ncbi:polysaccharide biosynthesis tyrosine autokinase [Bacteroides sp. 519]|uniref:GumC family protein n=1 Tax=Bacteroides sp. 519 TaxID=2302937 RepID=UPI0013CF734E|nr:polysaccharide biosynthesis tyrosine autokinase [Bacteroides sp. 519]NDV60220.1 hypothetical protein [Bacteroides sp. 519]